MNSTSTLNLQTRRQEVLLRRIRLLLWIFIIGLVLSGATAIPLESELKMLTAHFAGPDALAGWLIRVRNGLEQTNAQFPFMAYGTDWLAFGHFVIGLAFIGPLRNPVKNVWVIEFGMISCLLVIPYALAIGGIRGIPMDWRLIDCSFGAFGIIPLWYCRKLICDLAKPPSRLVSDP